MQQIMSSDIRAISFLQSIGIDPYKTNKVTITLEALSPMRVVIDGVVNSSLEEIYSGNVEAGKYKFVFGKPYQAVLYNGAQVTTDESWKRGKIESIEIDMAEPGNVNISGVPFTNGIASRGY